MKNTADAKTRKFDVTVNALGVYCSSIEVPADFSYEEALEYAKMHLDEIPMGNYPWPLFCLPQKSGIDISSKSITRG